MSDESKQIPRIRPMDVVNAAVKGGVKAVSGARDAWRSEGAKRLRGGVKSVMDQLAGVSRFVKGNTLKGLLTGEIVLSEGQINGWFAKVEPPESVVSMSLRCRPSRLVLVMEYERRLLGVRVARPKVELPFEILDASIDAEGGTIELLLDEDATPTVRGFLKPLILRLLSRAAADLLDGRNPADGLGISTDFIRRDGSVFVIDIGRYPPFRELMDRELRLPGGKKLYPFRALAVEKVTVEEGQLIVRTSYHKERIGSERARAALEEHLGPDGLVLPRDLDGEPGSDPGDDEDSVEITIL